MSDYKPKGKELKIAKKIQKMMEKFRGDHGVHAVPTPASIHVDFTVEGTRTNGHESVTSLLDVQKDLRWSFDEIRKTQRDLLNQEDDILLMLLQTMEVFTVCPECKGEKGGFGEPRLGYQTGTWQDCVECEGRGILFPPNQQVVKKGAVKKGVKKKSATKKVAAKKVLKKKAVKKKAKK